MLRHAPVLQLDVPEFLQETIASIVAFLPRLVAALVILLIGWVAGVAVAKVVRALADRVELDRMVLETPLGRMLGGSQRAVSSAFGTVAKWFVYALAILAAANVLAIALLSEWIATAVSYLPAFVAGLLVIVLGFVVADFIGDAIERTRQATQASYTSWFASGTRMFLYFTAIVIGLDTMGIDVSVLYVFANAFAWGLAAAIALAVGIAVGWGGHDYVSENIGRWMGRASSAAPRPGGASQADGGAATGATLDAEDEGKPVVTSDGKRIGILTRVRRGIGHVDPDPDVGDAVRSRLDWGATDEETHPLHAKEVAEVTDDEVRLR